MAIKTKTSLKSFFEKGDQPTSAQFSHLIDSMIKIPVSGASAKVGFIEVESTASATAHAFNTFIRTFITTIDTSAKARNYFAITSASAGGGGAAGQAMLAANTTASTVSLLGAKTVGTTILQASNTAAVHDTLGAGYQIQVAVTTNSNVSSTSTIIPFDDTIPQNTEGAQFMTISITPQRANSFLDVDCVTQLAVGTAAGMSGALFRNNIAGAVAANGISKNSGGNALELVVRARVTASAVSAQTFAIRLGPSSSTISYFNGQAGSRRFGGVSSSMLRVIETAR